MDALIAGGLGFIVGTYFGIFIIAILHIAKED